MTIADVTFDRVEYDAEEDVLYLHVGDPSRAVDFDETPEGHAVRFDRQGDLVGLTLVRPKRLLEAVPGVTDGGGNRARGNGNPAQCTNVACS